MARPKVFVSSTYYDLRYIRASLEIFIESLGFDAILSEKGDIAYTSDRPLDESCYREVENADIFTLILGGRYGSEVSSGSKKPKDFFDRYESITKKEYSSAIDKDIPVYILIEKAVYAEYQTFMRNKDVKGIDYAHVESVNVFLFIEEILAKPRNNPVQPFERFEDIDSWLREQWAGLFRELLKRQSQSRQLAGLSEQVSQLKETNETLKKYLEAVMRGAGKQATSKLIRSEEKRLSEVERLAALRRNMWVRHMAQPPYEINFNTVAAALREATGFEDFADIIQRATKEKGADDYYLSTLREHSNARKDLNEARRILDLAPFEAPDDWARTPSARPDEVASSSEPGPRPDKDFPPGVRVPVRRKGAGRTAAKKAAKTPRLTSGS
jgi:hypothetical protein